MPNKPLSDEDVPLTQNDWLEEYEGQLAIDVYQTNDSVVVKAPIAGVKPDELEISITDDVVNIKGQRQNKSEVSGEHYFVQECYWGAFSRSYILPVAVESEKASAQLKDGILTITIPKLEKAKTKLIEIKAE